MLPYLEIDQSGVLFTALAFGKALVLSDVGGFSEVGAGRACRAGDARALRDALEAVLADPDERERLAAAARRAACGRFSWASVARDTLALYATLCGPAAASRDATVGSA